MRLNEGIVKKYYSDGEGLFQIGKQYQGGKAKDSFSGWSKRDLEER